MNLLEENTFHWRVRSQNAAGKSEWTASWSFTTDAAVGISDLATLLPKEYSLGQNYPNPFNPVTTIKYKLAKAGKVSLILYNLLGQKVIEMVNESKPAGGYSYTLNSANLTSGTYFYRLKAGTFTAVRHLLLLK